MMNKQPMQVLLVLMAVSAAAAINFPEYLMGSAATVKNLLVSAAYPALWIFIPGRILERLGPRARFFFILFWGGTLLIALVTAYVNVTGGSAVWAILPALPLLGPWYGVMFFATDFLVMAALVALFSLGMVVRGLVLFRKRDRA